MAQIFLVRTLAIAAGLLIPSSGFASGPFDGRWSIDLQCPPSSDGALPFSWRFGGLVQNGALRAEHGQAGRAAYLLLSGRISPAGDASLVAQGITGTKGYNVRGASAGVPYTYSVPAHFSGNSGEGYWVGVRRCEFSFARQ